MVFYGLRSSDPQLLRLAEKCGARSAAWRTCEMDRSLCHKAAALTVALELGACLRFDDHLSFAL